MCDQQWNRTFKSFLQLFLGKEKKPHNIFSLIQMLLSCAELVEKEDFLG